MLNTFDALAKFPSESNGESESTTSAADNNATVDMSAIINRLNEMETKINQLVNKATEIPARGNEETPQSEGATNNPTNNGENNEETE